MEHCEFFSPILEAFARYRNIACDNKPTLNTNAGASLPHVTRQDSAHSGVCYAESCSEEASVNALLKLG